MDKPELTPYRGPDVQQVFTIDLLALEQNGYITPNWRVVDAWIDQRPVLFALLNMPGAE